MMERRLIAVEGVVQGVGFRPYVHRLAAANDLRGSVRNDASGVVIDVEGERGGVVAFCASLTLAPPPLAAITRIDVVTASPRSYEAFSIAASGADAREYGPTLIPADVATCRQCLAELFDPGDRRFRHPFITCTDCGPRFTIVRDTPYDRERTTMSGFPLCADCEREYNNPADRRFHAEAIACCSCGPTLRVMASAAGMESHGGADALESAVSALRDGRIVALKALGGYHLACDATNAAVVGRLRARKGREAKPLAVMVRHAAEAARLCVVAPAERTLLESRMCPIVLLPRRDDAGIADSVAPGQRLLGVMLPSTPLHHLLLAGVDRPLVMTSGNRSDEPVAIDDDVALATLASVADLFLVHDRPIAARSDDSVVRVVAGDTRLVRRSRGYAPQAIRLARPAGPPVLAVGGHLKNTVCLATESHAILSAHIGDLETIEARRAMQDAVGGMLRAARVTPWAIAHDLHPDYASTHVADALVRQLGVERLVAVQHHHAHVAACVVEHGVVGPVIGVVFDGAGLGTDGAIWGGEFLLVDGAAFERCGHLAYTPLPGGDACARRPWRSAAAHLAACGVDGRRPDGVDALEWSLVQQLLSRSSQQPRTSSVGRLFDAVASILGLRQVSRFEGEAAMAVEVAADPCVAGSYDAPIEGDATWTVDTGAIIRGVVDDQARGRSVAEIAGRFHVALRDLIVAGCMRMRAATGVEKVALTGGVFMNALLLTGASEALSALGFRVLVPRQAPCNDGGLSLGQAYVAARALDEEGPCA